MIPTIFETTEVKNQSKTTHFQCTLFHLTKALCMLNTMVNDNSVDQRFSLASSSAGPSRFDGVPQVNSLFRSGQPDSIKSAKKLRISMNTQRSGDEE